MEVTKGYKLSFIEKMAQKTYFHMALSWLFFLHDITLGENRENCKGKQNFGLLQQT